jgi:hypothetical protein
LVFFGISKITLARVPMAIATIRPANEAGGLLELLN